jgi:hypothetical protein
MSTQALERSHQAHRRTQAVLPGHAIAGFGQDAIAALAHELWQAGGCPEGSSEEDWFHAAEQLRSRSNTA